MYFRLHAGQIRQVRHDHDHQHKYALYGDCRRNPAGIHHFQPLLQPPAGRLHSASPSLFISQGEFRKWNGNLSGFDDYVENTPQAFMHFSFEASDHNVVITDIQVNGHVRQCKRAQFAVLTQPLTGAFEISADLLCVCTHTDIVTRTLLYLYERCSGRQAHQPLPSHGPADSHGNPSQSRRRGRPGKLSISS